jgi:aminoglycoside phosphotransferase (APT) family kinase protein
MQPAVPTAAPDTGAATLAERLRAVVARALDDDQAAVTGLERLTGGANSETWCADVRAGGAGHRLVLRLPMGDGAVARFATEAAALRLAAAAGVPEPAVVAFDDDPAELGVPFMLTVFIEGETLARRILTRPELAGARAGLAAECGAILARIHAIAPAHVPGLEVVDPLALLRGLLDGFEDAQPALELGYRWLATHQPPAAAQGLVHGDFRNGNLIVDERGVRAVLDWEAVHVGDPMEDLGYLCARVWRFGGDGPVGGFGARADLYAAYERAGGAAVDPAVVRWWELWATVRWGAGCLQMGARHLGGARRSVELAAIGRRAWEQEYDVLLLLDELGAA